MLMRYYQRLLALMIKIGNVVAIGSAFCCVASVAVAGDTPTVREQRDVRPEAVRAAVDRALPLLVRASSVEYPKHRDCFSCHNQGVPAVALTLARQRGFAIKQETLTAIAEHTEADLNSAIDDYRSGKGQPGARFARVTLFGRSMLPVGKPMRPPVPWLTISRPSRAIAIMSRNRLIGRRRNSASSRRPRSPYGVSTHLSQSCPPPRPAVEKRPARSRGIRNRLSLTSGFCAVGEDEATRHRGPRLSSLGLEVCWRPPSEIARAVGELLDKQKPDGGWSQLDEAPKTSKAESGKGSNLAKVNAANALVSDAYATGSAMGTLVLAGALDSGHAAYRRGLEFLLRTQRADGSWFVKSRSRPFQKYFESGFPHGPDQFISAAASDMGSRCACAGVACDVIVRAILSRTRVGPFTFFGETVITGTLVHHTERMLDTGMGRVYDLFHEVVILIDIESTIFGRFMRRLHGPCFPVGKLRASVGVQR